jgi:hypothetical protein
LVELPFRLRLGDFYRHAFAFRGGRYEVVFRNRTSVPRGTGLEAILGRRGSFDYLWTEALVVVRHPSISDEGLGRLQTWSPSEGEMPPVSLVASGFKAMEALNHFLVAYSTSSGEIFGGKPLRLFRTPEFLDFVTWEISIFCEPDYDFTDEEYLELFDIKADREIAASDQMYGDLDDLDLGEVQPLIEESLRLQETYVHHELAFEAKTKMVAGDYVGALLLAVAALEGAHAALVQLELESRLEGSGRDLPDEFLRELGMSLCNKLTPFLFMNASQRPTVEQIRAADCGLRIRNDIMHSLKNRRGEYRIRTRTNREISDAYSAVLTMYGLYATALGSRV